MTATATTTIKVPATSKAPAAVVELALDGGVTLDGELIGTLTQGEYTYSPRAAGHSGRIARFHQSMPEWGAEAIGGGYKFNGGIYPSHYRKNTRKAALAFLVAVASGVPAGEAGYFTWSRS